MPNKKNDKKPIVNWFSRKKEVSYSDSTSADGKKLKIKTKVVTAPDSKMSKGFEKKKVVETVKRKDPNLFKKIGAAASGIALSVASGENFNKQQGQKRLNNIQNNPRFSQATKQGLIDDMKLRDKYVRGGLTTVVAAPIVGAAIDKARGKTKQVTISKTKTKNK
jgi:hypothetical protein